MFDVDLFRKNLLDMQTLIERGANNDSLVNVVAAIESDNGAMQGLLYFLTLLRGMSPMFSDPLDFGDMDKTQETLDAS